MSIVHWGFCLLEGFAHDLCDAVLVGNYETAGTSYMAMSRNGMIWFRKFKLNSDS